MALGSIELGVARHDRSSRFSARGLKMPKPSVVSFSVHLRNSLLRTGRHVGLRPESFMHFGAMRSAFKVLPVDFPVTPRTAAIVTLKSRTLNPAAQLFINCAREVVEPLIKKQVGRNKRKRITPLRGEASVFRGSFLATDLGERE